jgi:ABC-type transporter Mla MlaB component
MLRITSRASHGAWTLELEGRLAGEWVEELRTAVASAHTPARGIRLRLAGLAFADEAGVALLRSLRDDGVELLDCSEFVVALVNGGRGWL